MTRVAIVGCGHWGKNYVRNFLQLRDVELVAVADLEPDLVSRVLGPSQEVKIYQDYKEMLQTESLDAVVVSTQATTHFDVISSCLDAGLDVLAEKPFTQTTEEAEKLIEKARAGNRVVMVSHTFLYNQAVRNLKVLLDEGEVGQVYYLKATRTHLGLIRSDVNAVWDLAPHDISIFNYLLNEQPENVQATGARFLEGQMEDVAFINLTYPSGVVASIHVSWADANKQRSVEIVGSKARVVFNDLDLVEPIRIFKKGVEVKEGGQSFGEFKYAIRDGDIISPRIQALEPLRTLCEHFVECVKTRQEPMTTAEQGRNVVAVLEQIDRELDR